MLHLMRQIRFIKMRIKNIDKLIFYDIKLPSIEQIATSSRSLKTYSFHGFSYFPFNRATITFTPSA